MSRKDRKRQRHRSRQMSDHHFIPKSRGGKDTVRIHKSIHEKYHSLFGNMTPDEILEYLILGILIHKATDNLQRTRHIFTVHHIRHVVGNFPLFQNNGGQFILEADVPRATVLFVLHHVYNTFIFVAVVNHPLGDLLGELSLGRRLSVHSSTFEWVVEGLGCTIRVVELILYVFCLDGCTSG